MVELWPGSGAVGSAVMVTVGTRLPVWQPSHPTDGNPLALAQARLEAALLRDVAKRSVQYQPRLMCGLASYPQLPDAGYRHFSRGPWGDPHPPLNSPLRAPAPVRGAGSCA